MKKRIVIKILCLILCFSMLLPTVAAATSVPQLPYGPQKEGTLSPLERYFTLKLGATTNQMAYVDYFYDFDGSFSEKWGEPLLHWLDMSEAEDGREDMRKRSGSGYLMLEQEMKFQDSSVRHAACENYIRLAHTAFDVLSLDIVSDLFSETAFEEKFEKAGKDTYVYYSYLQQYIVEYVANLQLSVDAVTEVWKTVPNLVADATEIASDAMSSNKIAVKVPVANAWLVVSNGKGSAGKIDVLDFDLDSMTVTIKGSESPVNLIDLINKRTENSKGLAFNFETLVDKKLLDKVDELYQKCFGGTGLRGDIDSKRLKGIFDGILETGITGKYREVFEKYADKLVNVQEIPHKLPEYCDKLGKTAEVIGIITSINQYNKEVASLTARQTSYLNALSSVTVEQLNMLLEWESAVLNNKSMKDREKEPILEAIAAVYYEIVNLCGASADEIERIAKEDAKRFAGKSYGDIWKGVVTSDIGQNIIVKVAEKIYPHIGKIIDPALAAGKTVISDAGKTLSDVLSKVTKKTVSIGGIVKTFFSVTGWFSIGNVFLDLWTNRFIDFDDRAKAISDMKKTLYHLLTDSNTGLLYRYARLRNHETACEIIEALNAMKYFKIAGENLVEEYYLYDFYRDNDISISGNVHLVLNNELAHRNGNQPFAFEEFTSPITILKYQKSPRVVGAGDTLPDPEVTEYYLRNPSVQVNYDGKPLDPLPSAYESLPSQKWAMGTMQSMNQLQNYDPYIAYYKDDGAFLYSRDSMEIILTKEECKQYLSLQKEINQLFQEYGDESRKIKWYEWAAENLLLTETPLPGSIGAAILQQEILEDQQTQYRLEWTSITKGSYIEAVKMYDPSTDYIEKYTIEWLYANGIKTLPQP